MRDTDRAKVYGAETELGVILSHPDTLTTLHGSTFLVPRERKFGNLEGVQRFVDAALKHVDKPTNVTVRRRKGQKAAHYETLGQIIAIPDESFWLRESIVLHELAHHLAPVTEKHGSTFRATLVDLLERVLAPEAAQMLRQLYWERGLKIG